MRDSSADIFFWSFLREATVSNSGMSRDATLFDEVSGVSRDATLFDEVSGVSRDATLFDAVSSGTWSRKPGSFSQSQQAQAQTDNQPCVKDYGT